jgi:hypothetical protein
MIESRGNHSPTMVSNPIEALTSPALLAERVSGREPSKRLLSLQRETHGVWREYFATRQRLSHAGERGGNRV